MKEESVKLEAKYYKLIKGFVDGKLEYKSLANGKVADKMRYLEQKGLTVVGIIVEVH